MAEQEKISTNGLSADFGIVGTEIYGGMIDVDYQEKWRNLRQRLDLIDEMIGSDATARQIVNAMVAPLLSAYYFLTPADDSPEAEEVKEFIEKNLFEYIDFQQFLVNLVTYKPRGFSLFAENYKVDGNYICWREFKFLEQKTVYSWGDNKEPWVDGHPQSVVQHTLSVDGESKFTEVKVPWNRIIRFTNNQIGNNYEGESCLRSAYSHWYYKQLLYKIVTIAAEKFGAGIPVMEYKTGTKKAAKERFKKMLRSIRSNERAYALYEQGNTFKIVTPEGNGKEFMMEGIRHHDKKMYDVCSCGFLNLTSGDGGSNALSKDQHEYFMETLEADADYILSVIQKRICRLVMLNGWPKELAPTLNISDIGEVDPASYVATMAIAKEKKLITYGMEDEQKVRSQMRLDPLDEDAEVDYEVEQPEVPGAEPGKEKEEEEEKPEKEQEKEENAKKKIKLARIAVSSAEKQFVKDISDYENYLEFEYAQIENLVASAEDKYKSVLRSLYKNAETERRDGVVVVVNSAANRAAKREAFKRMKAITSRLESSLVESNIENRMFQKTQKMAMAALKNHQENLARFDAKVGSFVDGYRSNVYGVLFNDPRRIEESVTLNFGSEVSQALAEQSVDAVSFNRNTLKLSTVTHARGAYNAIQYDENIANGYTFFKVLAPKSKIKELAPAGTTASVLFGIYTAAQLNQMMHENTDGKNTSAVNGLGLHHGSFVYYMPISSENLEEEQAISDAQRADLEAALASE